MAKRKWTPATQWASKWMVKNWMKHFQRKQPTYDYKVIRVQDGGDYGYTHQLLRRKKK
ncbi:MAG: hypothetical protein GY777_27785 [Candidatus Brocadiaceae bacterium]|jgi:hypothetical protein|nr:hypothetical protein [Candidatus Brocadiaceae bacterium]